MVLRYQPWRREGVSFRSSRASEASPFATLASHGEKGYLCRVGGEHDSPASSIHYRSFDYPLAMGLLGKFIKKDSTTFSPASVLPEIMKTLTEEGYRPVRDAEVRVVYEEEEILCCFYYSEEEPDFLLVQATFERGAFDEVDDRSLHRACAQLSQKQKVSKAYIDEEGDVVVAVETFLFAGVSLAPLALHMSRALGVALASFYDILEELSEGKKTK